MAGKHVRFETPPSTPSPSSSTSSLPSSPGPFTPPSLSFGSPYRTVPLPGIVAVHPILSAEHAIPVDYDVSYQPSELKPLTRLLPHFWDEPATNPQVQSIEIVCSLLPWKITITANPKRTYITVRDVLDGLYRALRLNVTPTEFALLPSMEAQHLVNNAYKRRYKRMSDITAYDEEKKGGVKRVDFLREKTHFMGFASTKQGTHVWKLITS